LLHYSQVRAGWSAGLDTIGDIEEYIDLHPTPKRYRGSAAAAVADYWLHKLTPSLVVRSRMEPGAAIYMARSPGYCCTGPDEHCYPPHTRGPSRNCVVVLCPGKLP
jgi:hypothetical protein